MWRIETEINGVRVTVWAVDRSDWQRKVDVLLSKGREVIDWSSPDDAVDNGDRRVVASSVTQEIPTI